MDLIEGTEVCVTGGTGYIASCLIHALLQRGYKVRTTVRNPDDKTKTGFLWEFPGAAERLQIFKAELLEEGSFDEAVYGVHTVFHTACPVLFDRNGDPEVLYTCLPFFSPFSWTSSESRLCTNSRRFGGIFCDSV